MNRNASKIAKKRVEKWRPQLNEICAQYFLLLAFLLQEAAQTTCTSTKQRGTQKNAQAHNRGKTHTGNVC